MDRALLPAMTIGLLACTAPNPDYKLPATGCAAGARACKDGRPVVCVPGGDGGTLLRTDSCPAVGTCAEGRCLPPPGAEACLRESDCTGLSKSCAPFVNASGTLQTYCAVPEGVTPGALSCTQHSSCRSGLCISGADGKGSCYLACATTKDCPTDTQCKTFSVTITGVQGIVLGCGPQ